jgi:hypothetical protein
LQELLENHSCVLRSQTWLQTQSYLFPLLLHVHLYCACTFYLSPFALFISASTCSMIKVLISNSRNEGCASANL